jgi:HlyD family secretion protein
MKNYSPAKTALVALAALLFAGCARREASAYQGYLEGEFVYVAAPLAGQLEHLAVTRGARIEAGAPALRPRAERRGLDHAGGG